MNKQSEVSFEEAMQELEQIVHTLETGKIKLDEAISVYERTQLSVPTLLILK